MNKEVDKRQKQGRVTQEEYRTAARACRGSIKKAEADLKFSLSKDGKGNKKGLYKSWGALKLECTEVRKVWQVAHMCGKGDS